MNIFNDISRWIPSIKRIDGYIRLGLTKPLFRAAMYIAFAFWSINDPMGLASAADRALSNQLGRFRAFIQPINTAPITVINIDYPSITGLHNSGNGWMGADDWPLTYADHGRILRDLAMPRGDESAPAAIFYDILFERPRVTSGNLGSLGRTLSRLQENHNAARIYLAGGGSFLSMSKQSLAQLKNPSLAVSAWEGVGDNYPLKAQLSNVAASKIADSAASILYQELCRARHEDCRWIQSTNLPPLSPQWYITENSDCPAGKMSIWHDVKAIIMRLATFSASLEYLPSSCIPVHQVRLSQLYGEQPVSLRPPHIRLGEPYVVLVGNVMPSLNDYVESPLYGQIAGVYLHANALINLINQGDKYIKERDVFWFSLLTLLVTIYLCMWFRGTLCHDGWFGRRRIWLVNAINKIEWIGDDSLIIKAFKSMLIAVFYVATVIAGYMIFSMFNEHPQGWLVLLAFIPFLKEVVLSGESRYVQVNKDSYE
ncbi:CHASE2 domain-containing protein [Aeromonas salmonicida]|uniref:CHASE2 domain-containing protein n=1 Tax=Aeromonas salmonicida TaxID=645 RepID=A0AAX3VQY2_AERSA|nr:CHASE2 domain-containing protein [Aeromonas salmonicida]WHF35268.1 CHASE2 domain-containing protein [Aeromonas salmonicida]